jgi:hypothetical protein
MGPRKQAKKSEKKLRDTSEDRPGTPTKQPHASGSKELLQETPRTSSRQRIPSRRIRENAESEASDASVAPTERIGPKRKSMFNKIQRGFQLFSHDRGSSAKSRRGVITQEHENESEEPISQMDTQTYLYSRLVS